MRVPYNTVRYPLNYNWDSNKYIVEDCCYFSGSAPHVRDKKSIKAAFTKSFKYYDSIKERGRARPIEQEFDIGRIFKAPERTPNLRS